MRTAWLNKCPLAPYYLCVRLLVIDDDAVVLRAVSRTLRTHGHEVVTCLDPREALERLTGGEVFDAIVSDVMMGASTGIELHAACAATVPEMARRFLFVTGSLGEDAVAVALAKTGCPVLVKPVRGAELIAAIEAVVARQ